MKEERTPVYLEKTTENELQKMPNTTTQKFKPTLALVAG